MSGLHVLVDAQATQQASLQLYRASLQLYRASLQGFLRDVQSLCTCTRYFHAYGVLHGYVEGGNRVVCYSIFEVSSKV